MIRLSDHFGYRKIFKITIAPILMMIFISLYGVVDGFFISNFAGADSYAGVNLIMPIIMIVGGLGFMIGTGGSALTAKLLGEQRKEEANQVFSMLLFFTILVGVSVSILGFFLVKPIASAMGRITEGTTQGMVEQAILYGRILVLGQTFFMTQNFFHTFFMVDEKPKLGFLCTVFAGVTNIIFDGLFVGIFKWGVVGAAVATIMGYVIGSIIPLGYFLTHKNDTICLVKAKLRIRPILRTCFNGMSEFVSNISSSIVGLVFNIQLLKYMSQNGVAAYGTVMYVSFIFIAVFIGYTIGIAPVISYNYGAKNPKEIRNVLLRSLSIIVFVEVIMVLSSFFGAPVLARLYSSGNEELAALSTKALRYYSFSFLFSGIGIFVSSFFTALNNGVISAINSFLRTLVFQISLVLILPLILGKDGIWYAMVCADGLACILGLSCLKGFQKKYGY